jgi:hypothetical protein
MSSELLPKIQFSSNLKIRDYITLYFNYLRWRTCAYTLMSHQLEGS